MSHAPDSSDTPTTGLLDRVKGKAKRLLGSLTQDKALEREGVLHEQRADATREAHRLAREAGEEREVADLVAREQELTVEEARLAAEETVAGRQERLEREREATEHDLNRQEARRKAAAIQAERATEASIDHDEADAMRERMRAQHAPDALEADAQRARQAADQLQRAAARYRDDQKETP
jgi:uncharacterized protein YjbJ (UPF0337 family)